MEPTTLRERLPDSDPAHWLYEGAAPMIGRLVGLLLIPVVFVCTLVLMAIRLLPDVLAQLQRQELIIIAILVAYAFFAATWLRSLISRIAVILLQIAMAIFLVG